MFLIFIGYSDPIFSNADGFFLFFGKYEPGDYQKQAVLTASEYKQDVGYVSELGNIRFDHINWSVDSHEKGIVVGDSILIPDDSLRVNHKLIKKIDFLNGNEAFKIVEVR